jgi:hypothetical protein
VKICQSKPEEADGTDATIGIRGKPMKLLRFLFLNQFLGGAAIHQVRIPPARMSSIRWLFRTYCAKMLVKGS